jgi:hypothetical protein
MTRPKDPPLLINLNLGDPASVAEAAEALGTTPEAIRATVEFAHTIMREAEGNDMTTGQLITALMSTLTILIKDCGDKADQDEMCHRLLEGLRGSLDLTATGTTLH